MNQIQCPNCNETFNIDDVNYAEIQRQVRSHEFEQEIAKRIQLLNAEKETAIELTRESLKNDFLSQLGQKNQELTELQARINGFETEKALAVSEATTLITTEKERLANQLASTTILKDNELETLKSNHALHISEIERSNEVQLRAKDEVIERYKDMKAKLNVKLLGESLEKHCQNEFDKLRSVAFPAHLVSFAKDTDHSEGTKADYIYREKNLEGTEIISIMFEMKNETDDVQRPQKNESFLKKLDADREQKKCEYAVLVTTLESDNDFYNNGIVDVSWKFPKMYVIRPQFFIPMITVLRNAAMNAAEYKNEIAIMKAQEIDITNFEKNLGKYKDKISGLSDKARIKFDAAISEIDKIILKLNDVKAKLLDSEGFLGDAYKQVDEMSIKKLTRGNPTLTRMFKELGPASDS